MTQETGKCSHQTCLPFTLWCSSHNCLSLSFQLAFLDFTSFPSVSLSALLALSTASRMRKPPRSVRARRTTPGLRQTHHLPPAHVRLTATAALCKALKRGSRHCVRPTAQSRADAREAVRACPPASTCQPVLAHGSCCPWGALSTLGYCSGWEGMEGLSCPYATKLAG